jgi:hypothetical protein
LSLTLPAGGRPGPALFAESRCAPEPILPQSLSMGNPLRKRPLRGGIRRGRDCRRGEEGDTPDRDWGNQKARRAAHPTRIGGIKRRGRRHARPVLENEPQARFAASGAAILRCDGKRHMICVRRILVTVPAGVAASPYRPILSGDFGAAEGKSRGGRHARPGPEQRKRRGGRNARPGPEK